MRKNVIKINEAQLKNVVTTSIKKVLKERYNLSDAEEIMEFMWLRPNATKLNIDIFVDDGGSYVRHGHTLLLLARNGYDKTVSEFMSFSVSENPIILNPEIEYHITYNDIFAVQDFICSNLRSLIALANSELSQREFIEGLKPYTPYSAVVEEKIILNEMATLRQRNGWRRNP